MQPPALSPTVRWRTARRVRRIVRRDRWRVRPRGAELGLPRRRHDRRELPAVRASRHRAPPARTVRALHRTRQLAQPSLVLLLELANADGEDTPLNQIEVIGGEARPLFVPLSNQQKDDILWGLKEMHEEWAGVELIPAIAYGE